MRSRSWGWSLCSVSVAVQSSQSRGEIIRHEKIWLLSSQGFFAWVDHRCIVISCVCFVLNISLSKQEEIEKAFNFVTFLAQLYPFRFDINSSITRKELVTSGGQLSFYFILSAYFLLLVFKCGYFKKSLIKQCTSYLFHPAPCPIAVTSGKVLQCHGFYTILRSNILEDHYFQTN